MDEEQIARIKEAINKLCEYLRSVFEKIKQSISEFFDSTEWKEITRKFYKFFHRRSQRKLDPCHKNTVAKLVKHVPNTLHL